MSHKYFPHTEADIHDMLEAVGHKSLDQLFDVIPDSIRFKGHYDLPAGMSELELRRHLEQLGQQNTLLTIFAGAGIYDHYTPSVVPNIIARSEYLTSYTPYQAEISQGTLHYIFEFQSMMAELTGMDISNASMYDGATATAEAAIMAVAVAKKADTVLISATIDPKIRRVVDTYAHYHGIKTETIEAHDGTTDRVDLERKLAAGSVAGVVVQMPNYYGIVEDYTGFADLIHESKALFIINSVAADLAVLKTPGQWGADVAVGDGQSLGIPMSYGGPSVGYMCCTERLVRKMPGRIVGMTRDNRGNRAFVLTLQAREQHIRRQKATSNICSNQSLMALFATVYMSLMGKQGLVEAANMSYAGAHYMCQKLIATGHFTLEYDQPFFNEFCLRYDGDIDALQARCLEQGFMAGIKTGEHTIMFAVTEKRTKEEIDRLVEVIGQNLYPDGNKPPLTPHSPLGEREGEIRTCPPSIPRRGMKEGDSIRMEMNK